VRKIQDKSKWAAAKSAEYRDIANNEDFFVQGSNLRKQARSTCIEVEYAFRKIYEWGNKLMDLENEITTTEEYLTWVSEKRTARAEAETAAVDGTRAVLG